MKKVRMIGLALTMLAPSAAFGGGFQSIEQGTWDMGRALVGAASAADSAATVFYNPAGMTLIEDTEIVGGLMAVLPDIEFDTEPGTTFTGGGTGNMASNTVVPAGPFFVHPVNEQLASASALPPHSLVLSTTAAPGRAATSFARWTSRCTEPAQPWPTGSTTGYHSVQASPSTTRGSTSRSRSPPQAVTETQDRQGRWAGELQPRRDDRAARGDAPRDQLLLRGRERRSRR